MIVFADLHLFESPACICVAAYADSKEWAQLLATRAIIDTNVLSNRKEMEPVIRFKDAEIVNGESTVIYDFNMEVFPGDFVYIVGKVGTGKTSIIKTMIAENPLGAGEAEVCGFFLKGIKDKNIPFLRRKMGVVFQDFQLLMDRSVEDNLRFVLEATGWKSRESENNRINEVLEAVGMSRKAHKMPHQLSGGEQQRIAIARALLNSPEVILADEPTGNLDAETAEGIMRLLSRLNSEGTAIVMVTHNLSIVKDYPGRVFVCANESCTEAAADSSDHHDKKAKGMESDKSNDSEAEGTVNGESVK